VWPAKGFGARLTGAEDQGDYDATYYVNDDITISDGEIMTSHDGRRFRIEVVLAE
jgi:hypothetical protein